LPVFTTERTAAKRSRPHAERNPLALQAAAAITPPEDHRPWSLGLGSGALTYEAQRARDGASVEWVLVEVSGELRDESGVMPHRGYAGLGATLATADPEGLTWTAPDGTRVSWSVETSVNAPEAGNAPWVLFRSVALGTPEHAAHGGGLRPGGSGSPGASCSVYKPNTPDL
jgi:hypothetical protein